MEKKSKKSSKSKKENKENKENKETNETKEKKENPESPEVYEKAAEDLKKAMEGFGTDEEKLILTVTSHKTQERLKIKKIYEEKYINYKNEEICEGEIICLKLLNYNINIVTAYEYIIYLTQNDLKLKELSLTNLNFLIINNLKQFIYNPSFDIAKECIIRIKGKI